MGSALEKAVKTGAPVDVEREMLKWLDDQDRRRGLLASVSQALSGVRQPQRLARLIEGAHEKDAVCAPRALLPLALNQGNVEVVRFLLGQPLGVKPRVPPHILFAYSLCSAESGFDEARRARRREAYALLLEAGDVDVNARSRFGQTVLQTCFEPELVSLFIEKGARTDVESGQGSGRLNLLEQALLDALVVAAEGGNADRRHGLARVRLFASLMSNSVRGRPVERTVRGRCATVLQGQRPYAAACRRLSGLVDATPGTWGEGGEAPATP